MTEDPASAVRSDVRLGCVSGPFPQKLLHFVLMLAPTSQLRPKVHSRVVRGGRMAAVAHKTDEQLAAEGDLAAFLRPFRPAEPLRGPVELRVSCYLAPPKSKPPSERGGLSLARWRRLSQEGCIHHASVPDMANLIKQIEDALTRSGFWGDDRQVAKIIAQKFYGQPPRWEIEIQELPVRVPDC